MPLAPVVATSLADSQVLDPLAELADYRVQVFSMTPTFGIGDLVADIAHVKNLGYADYVNDVGEMFLTLHQDDDQLSTILEYLGRAHYRILRRSSVVHAGWLMESDEAEDDVVLYGYGYIAGLYWYLTNWDHSFSSLAVSEIARLLWRHAITYTSSMMTFIATGAIEGAQEGSDGGGQIVLPAYPVYYKRILHALQELAALGLSDTNLNVVFEITHAETPVFNFWHNKGKRLTGVRLSYGDGGQIQSFRRRRSPIFRRNDVYAVGSAPHAAVLRKNLADASDMLSYGRRQEPLFLSWVRDESELERVGKLRLKHATREDFDLSIKLKPNSFLPPGAYGSQIALTDSFIVQIKRGATDLERYMQMVGYQVVVDGEERVNLLLQEDRSPLLSMDGLPSYVVNDATYNAFPSMTRLANGNLLCVYRTGTDHIAPPDDGMLKAKISTNNGVTWGAATTVWDHATLDVRDPAVSVMSDGTIFVTTTTYSGTGGVATGEFLAYVIKSTNNGSSWGSPVAVGSTYIDQREVGGAPIVELSNGRLMIPICGRVSASGDDTEGVVVLFSDDDGATWIDQTTVVSVAAEFYTEPVIITLADGTLHCLIRDNTNLVIFRTTSSDNGLTWGSLLEVFDSQTKPSHAQLADGTLLTVLRSGLGVNQDTVYRTSDNRGVTWSTEIAMQSPDQTNMYASIVTDGPNRALVVYGAEVSSTDADILFQRFS